MEPIKVEKSKIVNVEKGMLLPQNVDAEQAVIGALIIQSSAVEDCFEIIKTPEVFYKDAHKLIFQAIQQLHSNGSQIDLITISKQLRAMNVFEKVGGDGYLIALSQMTSSAAHIEVHSRLLIQEYIKRSVIRMNQETMALAYDESVDSLDLLSGFQKLFDNITDAVMTGRKTMSFADSLGDLKKRIEMLSTADSEQKLVGVDTGFLGINKFTGGWREQDLVIIAARPGMGKTAYVLKSVVSNAKIGEAVGFISLEMSMYQLTARIVAIETSFHLGQLMKTGFEKSEYFTTYSAYENRMKDYPIFIDDSGNSDVSHIVLKAKQWKRKNDIKLLVIDYLQLMTDRNVKGNREAEINSISRRLKQLAKELNIPVIALSQLSRAVETRGSSKRPLLSDLRDSGAIEQDADIVKFIYRPEYYNIQMDESEYDNPKHKLAISNGANTEIIFAKYRGGSLGTALLKWVGDKTKFVDPMDEMDKVEYVDNANLPKIDPSSAFALPSKEVDDNDPPF